MPLMKGYANAYARSTALFASLSAAAANGNDRTERRRDALPSTPGKCELFDCRRPCTMRQMRGGDAPQRPMFRCWSPSQRIVQSYGFLQASHARGRS